jgi:hypothetical protein
MSKRNNEVKKSQLALALAAGGTVKAWAKENAVRPRTAYTWSRCPEVLEQIDRIRSRALDRAIGRLSKNVTAAAEEIASLARGAASESVKLNAARAVLADLMSVSNYAALERRLAQVERRMRDNSRFPAGPDQPPRPTTDDGQRREEAESCPAC